MEDDQPLDLSIKRKGNSAVSSSSAILQLLTKPNARRNPCPCCGIGFSSPKTLQAHTEFYCTKKRAESANSIHEAAPGSPKFSPQVSLSSAPTAVTTLNKGKSGQYCTYCAFRANTVRGLRSHITKYHLRDTTNSKESKSKTSSRPSMVASSAFKRPRMDGATPMTAPNGMQEKKKFCKYCDISFKYLSTFLAHRKFYCTVRKETGVDVNAKPVLNEVLE